MDRDISDGIARVALIHADDSPRFQRLARAGSFVSYSNTTLPYRSSTTSPLAVTAFNILTHRFSRVCVCVCLWNQLLLNMQDSVACTSTSSVTEDISKPTSEIILCHSCKGKKPIEKFPNYQLEHLPTCWRQKCDVCTAIADWEESKQANIEDKRRQVLTWKYGAWNRLFCKLVVMYFILL